MQNSQSTRVYVCDKIDSKNNDRQITWPGFYNIMCVPVYYNYVVLIPCAPMCPRQCRNIND